MGLTPPKIKPMEELENNLIDATDKCIIEWIEDGVLGCTFNHKDNELCLDMICKDCRHYKCSCFD